MSSEQAMSSYVDELKKVKYLTVFILFVSVVKWLFTAWITIHVCYAAAVQHCRHEKYAKVMCLCSVQISDISISLMCHVIVAFVIKINSNEMIVFIENVTKEW